MANRLSKSRFQTGLQCHKALWLSTHDRDLADPTSDTQQHIFDTGTSVGELARECFADGVLVAEDYTQSAAALLTTRRLLEDPPSAIFEAALEYGGVFVRPDVLVRVGDNLWDLYEVKSTTRVKAVHITDIAVQTWVLEGAGLPIRRAYLMHLDNTYTYSGGDYDLARLFRASDVTADARAYLPQVPTLVAEMIGMLDVAEPPSVAIGKHCRNPYTCAFYGSCHALLPATPVRSGEPAIVGDIKRSLAGLTSPIHFLDFETFMSALPLLQGTRPWQAIPFQWSDHILHENGDLEHSEFLHEGTGDPRPGFIGSLIDALGDAGSVVVYSSYENTQLNALATAFPQHAGAIAKVQSRIFDLLNTVRTHVRHPDCLGSSSIKVVLPALVSDLSYKGLGIADGSTASMRYVQAFTNQLPAEDCATVYADLREYCGMDTMAMVRLLEVLREG